MENLEALQELLSRVNSSEPSCPSESITGRDVTALNGLSDVAVTAMQPRAHMASEWNDLGQCFHIRLAVISNDRVRGYLGTSKSLPKERLCTGPIPFVTQEHINDLPVLVYCTI